MRLIDLFESADEQNVKTFNNIFKATPICMPDHIKVEIHDPANADTRWVKVGDNFTRVNLTLSDTKNTATPRVKLPKRRVEYLEPYKNCSQCKEYLHFDNFTRHAKSSGGVRSYCKKCQNTNVQNRKKLLKKMESNNELHNSAE